MRLLRLRAGEVGLHQQRRVVQQPVLPLAEGDLAFDQPAHHAHVIRPADRVAADKAVAAELPAYVDEGWSFVALKLTGDVPFDGSLDPIRFTFASDELIYPMRMSRAAEIPQTVRLSVLGDHRVDVVGSDGDLSASVDVLWAGEHTSSELASLGSYLTVVDIFYGTPATQVTEDLLLPDAPSDAPSIPTFTIVHQVEFGGIPLGPLLVVLGGVLVAALAGLTALLVARRSRA